MDGKIILISDVYEYLTYIIRKKKLFLRLPIRMLG